MRLFKTVLLVCSVLFIVNGCTAPKGKESRVLKKEIGAERINKSFTIKPRGSYEECIELGPGMVFDYDYKASDFVNFNIHYHGEEKVHYPVMKRGYMKGRGMIDPHKHEFHSKDQEYYCLMWENKGTEKVNVSFSCVLRNK